MSKTLFLVRHAKSSWADPGMSDYDRPLNQRGLRDAPQMGLHLKNSGIFPELIICSTAIRARQTLEHLNLGIENTVFENRIYEASAETLLEIIQSIENSYTSAMLIGHNPGMTWLATDLSGRRIENLPTCAVARISLKTDKWNRAGTCPSRLENLDYPKRQK